MTYYNNFEKLNNTYLSSQESWFNNFSSYMISNFGWQMPAFNFNWNVFTDFSSFNFSEMFSSNIWNTPFNQNINYNFNNIFNNDTFNSFTVGDTFTSSKKGSTSLQLKLADTAKSYLGKVNSDAEGNKLFSGGKTQPWCADFVSYVTKEALGSKLPSSFKNFSSVSSLKQWGQNNGCYSEVPSTGKAEYIAQNVKIGDIMIEKKAGKSHTGVVTKVNSDGSFETVEGNCGNKVATRHYTADSPTLSGFISLKNYTA